MSGTASLLSRSLLTRALLTRALLTRALLARAWLTGDQPTRALLAHARLTGDQPTRTQPTRTLLARPELTRPRPRPVRAGYLSPGTIRSHDRLDGGPVASPAQAVGQMHPREAHTDRSSRDDAGSDIRAEGATARRAGRLGRPDRTRRHGQRAVDGSGRRRRRRGEQRRRVAGHGWLRFVG